MGLSRSCAHSFPEWAEQGWLPVAACEIPHKTFPRNAMDAAAKSVATSPMTLSAA
jgi:hypothetical protein